VVGLTLAKPLYALAVVLLPLSYGTKLAFGWDAMVWVDPTLVLAIPAFLLVGARPIDRLGLLVAGTAFFSASVGAILLTPSGGSLAGLYDVYREPIRLLLNLVWFWTSVRLFTLDKSFVLNWLAVSVTVQLLIGCYLLVSLLGWVPIPDQVRAYTADYLVRQSLHVRGLIVPRMGGSFVESPPFGLFMFSAFAIFTLALFRERLRGGLLVLGFSVSLLGSLLSLSDQILMALAWCLLSWLVLARTRLLSLLTKPLVAALVVTVSIYVAASIVQKVRISETTVAARSGLSVGERMFHSAYAMDLLAEHPALLLFGIGPGRYGDYATRTGRFPDTVTVQVTAVEWLVEYGVLGMAVILAWIARIGGHAVRGLGWLGLSTLGGLLLANMFQANWKWEAWFMGLAYLNSARHAYIGRPALGWATRHRPVCHGGPLQAS